MGVSRIEYVCWSKVWLRREYYVGFFMCLNGKWSYVVSRLGWNPLIKKERGSCDGNAERYDGIIV